jgi:hypothetical protein
VLPRLVLLGIAALIASVVLASSAASAPTVQCGSFVKTYRIEVSKQGKIPCRSARLMVKDLLSGRGRVRHGKPGAALPYYTLARWPGWKCRAATGGGACAKGSQRVKWKARPPG